MRQIRIFQQQAYLFLAACILLSNVITGCAQRLPPSASEPDTQSINKTNNESAHISSPSKFRIVDADESDAFYDIVGGNSSELSQSIKNNSPFGSFGYTQFNGEYNWRAVENGTACKMTSLDLRHQILVNMPRWTNISEAKACLQTDWQRVWDLIQKHEETHREIYRELAKDIPARLWKVEPQENCETLKVKIEREYEAVLLENKKKHEAFHETDPSIYLQDC